MRGPNLRWWTAVFSVVVFALSACVADDGAHAAPPKPNIIVILADDMGYGDLGVTGQKHFTTPRLDRMAREGLLFTQFYAGSTVCAPSRATLLTGQHTGHIHQRGNGNVAFRRDPHDLTLATRLKQAGYHTAMIGKSGVACDSDDGHLPNDKGFDHFFGFSAHLAAHRYYPRELWRNGEKVAFPDNSERAGTQYSGDLFLEETLIYLEQQRAGPFFLHLALQQPHADMAAPEAYRARFVGRFDEAPYPPGQHYRAETHPAATYAAMMTYLDESVGRILDKLSELGIAENTLVLFASDNGPHQEGGYHYDMHNSNGPFRGGKRDLYEGGLRVPLIAWWPGTIAPGQQSDHIAAMWDIAPTALELAGLAIPEEMDGVSLLPTFIGQPDRQTIHPWLYWEFHEQGGKQAVRMGRWKGVRLNVHRDRNGPIELYDLETDPGETTNVAADHPEVVAEIARIMTEAHTPGELFRF